MSNKFITTIASGALALGLGVSLAQAAAPPTPQGMITEKVFFNTGPAATVASLTSSPNFPNNPDFIAYPTYFELWATGDPGTPPPDTSGYIDYGSQMLGYFYPDVTGPFVFYICSDDNSDLYLSTDDTAANKKLIAQEQGWATVRTYTGDNGGDVTAKCSSTFTNTTWPTKDTINGGAIINLTKGKAYYIEAVMKQGGGSDNLSVSIDEIAPIAGSYLSTINKTLGPLSITTQPQSVGVIEGQPATFTVVPDGTPPYTYQWEMNGTALANATNTAYTISRVYRADNGAKFDVVVTGATGTLTSSPATLTVTNDTTPPAVVSASSSSSFNGVVVTFSEPLDPASATNTANYSISNGVTVTAAALGAAPGTPGDNVVALTTSLQPPSSIFTLTVNNVKDVPGNVIAPNTQVQFRSFVYEANTILHKVYYNCSPDGFTLANLFADPRYPNNPDAVDLVSTWEWPPNDAGTIAADPNKSMYYDSLEGYFIPPTSGDYVFYSCGDDEWYMYLSTDDNPANMYEIAAEPGNWSNNRDWNTMQTGNTAAPTVPAPANWNSATYSPPAWPNGNTITLTAGNKYYLILFHHDHSWSGGDWYGATYSGGAVAVPADGDVSKLTGSVVGVSLNPAGSSLTITNQPADTTGVEGRSVTFSVGATASSPYASTVSYQWQSAPPGSSTFTNIAGATSNPYTVPVVWLTDSGTKFQVVCRMGPVAVTSSAVTLTVVPDTSPPVVLGAGALKNQAGTFDVGILFDKPLNWASATAATNYALSTGTIQAINIMTNSPAVVLTASGLTAGATATATVKSAVDYWGNTMGSTNIEFTVSGMAWGEVGGDETAADPTDYPGPPNYVGGFPAGYGVVAVGTNGFDLYSDGWAEWNNYDETTFVYEPITGDFDKKLQVVYQDLSSEWARAASS